MAGKKMPFGIPDFGKGIGGAAFIIFFGLAFMAAAIYYKKNIIYIIIGILLFIRGIYRLIENSKEPKEKRVSVIKYVKEQMTGIPQETEEEEAPKSVKRLK